MISTYSLGALRQARIWRNELPFSLAGKGMFLQWETTTTAGALRYPYSLCCEMVMLPNIEDYYAMLGFHYTPLKQKSLIFTLGYTDVEEEMFHDSLLSTDYFPFKGMPEEHVHAVMRIVENPRLTRLLPAGNYLLMTAAHDVVGSSEVTFAAVARVLLKIMSQNPQMISDAEIIGILSRASGVVDVPTLPLRK